jgi:hypothetical protein
MSDPTAPCSRGWPSTLSRTAAHAGGGNACKAADGHGRRGVNRDEADTNRDFRS